MVAQTFTNKKAHIVDKSKSHGFLFSAIKNVKCGYNEGPSTFFCSDCENGILANSTDAEHGTGYLDMISDAEYDAAVEHQKKCSKYLKWAIAGITVTGLLGGVCSLMLRDRSTDANNSETTDDNSETTDDNSETVDGNSGGVDGNSGGVDGNSGGAEEVNVQKEMEKTCTLKVFNSKEEQNLTVTGTSDCDVISQSKCKTKSDVKFNKFKSKNPSLDSEYNLMLKADCEEEIKPASVKLGECELDQSNLKNEFTDDYCFENFKIDDNSVTDENKVAKAENNYIPNNLKLKNPHKIEFCKNKSLPTTPRKLLTGDEEKKAKEMPAKICFDRPVINLKVSVYNKLWVSNYNDKYRMTCRDFDSTDINSCGNIPDCTSILAWTSCVKNIDIPDNVHEIKVDRWQGATLTHENRLFANRGWLQQQKGNNPSSTEMKICYHVWTSGIDQQGENKCNY